MRVIWQRESQEHTNFTCDVSAFVSVPLGGTEISFTMAIDYTASNGSPADPRSLHYIDPMGMEINDYAKAMSGIGRVLEFYGEEWEFSRGVGWDWRPGWYHLLFPVNVYQVREMYSVSPVGLHFLQNFVVPLISIYIPRQVFLYLSWSHSIRFSIRYSILSVRQL